MAGISVAHRSKRNIQPRTHNADSVDQPSAPLWMDFSNMHTHKRTYRHAPLLPSPCGAWKISLPHRTNDISIQISIQTQHTTTQSHAGKETWTHTHTRALHISLFLSRAHLSLSLSLSLFLSFSLSLFLSFSFSLAINLRSAWTMRRTVAKPSPDANPRRNWHIFYSKQKFGVKTNKNYWFAGLPPNHSPNSPNTNI